MPQLCSRNPEVGRLFAAWNSLHRWRLFKFFLREDPFNLFDILLEQDAKRKFLLEESSRYGGDMRKNTVMV
jgi:hypothetical protein